MNLQQQLETLRISYSYSKVMVYSDGLVYYGLSNFGKKTETELNELISKLNLNLIAKCNDSANGLFSESCFVGEKV